MLGRSRPLSISPLGVAAIFLTGCMAGAAVQALGGGSGPAVAALQLDTPPPPIDSPFTVANVQPLTHRVVKAFAVRGDGKAPSARFD